MSRHQQPAAGTEQQVRELAQSLHTAPIVTIERMTYGHGGVTYKCSTADNALIVRTSTDREIYAGTAQNLRRLHELGLPVPTVVAADLTQTQYPFCYVVTDAFPGRDLRFEIEAMTPAQLTTLAEQIVGFERAVTCLPAGGGYGFAPLDAQPRHSSWLDAVKADRGSIRAPGARRELRGLVDETYAALNRAAARLVDVHPTCFLDDLTTKNVIVHQGVLQGVVDFDVVCFGDPMYWLALTQVAVLYDVGDVSVFYVDELRRLWVPTPLESANLALYSALHACEFLAWNDHNAATEVRMETAVRTWLDEAFAY